MAPTLTAALTVVANTAALPADDPAAPSWLPGAMAAAGVSLLTFVSLRIWFRRRAASRKRGERSPRERLNELAQSSQRDSLESLMVEVQELTRSCAAQLENRTAKLEALMAQADTRLDELRSALAAEHRPAPAVSTGSVRTPEPRLAAISGARPDPLAARVHELATAGMSSVDIARSLDEQVGKVELILNLEAKRSA